MPPEQNPWDAILDRAASGRSSTDSRRRRLALSPDPRPHWLPNKRRSFGLVHPDLLSPLRELCDGAAAWPLFVHGPGGTGKTSAALALLDHLAGDGRGWYFGAPQLAQLLADLTCGRAPPSGPQSVSGLWEALSCSRLVVLDEVGRGSRDHAAPPYLSHHHCEAVRTLLDVRENLCLVLCSNFGMADLYRLYGDAVASRLAGGTVVALEGPDRRIGATVG